MLTRAYETRGGMSGVAADVQDCYAAADRDSARNAAWPSEYRFCVLYDAVAYRSDNTHARERGLPRGPYFEPDVAALRWERHILAAGQGRRSELDAFMMKGAAAVGPFLPVRILTGPGSAAADGGPNPAFYSRSKLAGSSTS